MTKLSGALLLGFASLPLLLWPPTAVPRESATFPFDGPGGVRVVEARSAWDLMSKYHDAKRIPGFDVFTSRSGKLRAYRRIDQVSPTDYYGFFLSIPWGTGLLFDSESTTRIHLSDGSIYESTEWILTKNHQKLMYVSGEIYAPVYVTGDDGFDGTKEGYIQLLCRFNFNRVPDSGDIVLIELIDVVAK